MVERWLIFPKPPLIYVCTILSPGHEDNFQLQMAKLGCGLMSGAYSVDSSIKSTSDDKTNKVLCSL